MSIDDKTLPLKELEFVVDEYSHWFVRLTEALFYPETQTGQKQLEAPQSFKAWLEKSEHKKIMEAKQLAELNHLNQNLLGLAQNLSQAALRKQKTPTHEEFSKLAGFFEQFTAFIKRVLRETGAGEEPGRDPVTGLYGPERFFKDIVREADRVERQGTSFCMALVRIDSFEKIRQTAGVQGAEECLQLVTSLILKCLRSFDDAYRGGDDLFMLSLKQAGTPEGIMALNRLKDDLEEKQAGFGGVPLSVSSCIAEPMPDENFSELVENMKRHMSTHAGMEGAVLEYYELSPLQKMMREGKP